MRINFISLTLTKFFLRVEHFKVNFLPVQSMITSLFRTAPQSPPTPPDLVTKKLRPINLYLVCVCVDWSTRWAKTILVAATKNPEKKTQELSKYSYREWYCERPTPDFRCPAREAVVDSKSRAHESLATVAPFLCLPQSRCAFWPKIKARESLATINALVSLIP